MSLHSCGDPISSADAIRREKPKSTIAGHRKCLKPVTWTDTTGAHSDHLYEMALEVCMQTVAAPKTLVDAIFPHFRAGDRTRAIARDVVLML